MKNKAWWRRFAKLCAADAYQNNFHSRRGIYHLEDSDVLVLYNNNPYSGGPQIRDEELARLRRRLKAEGIEELAYATFPDDGYTYALIVDASRDREELVAGLMQAAVLETFGG